MTRALVISAEPVGGEMLGSAIRAYELARALAPHADVTLACPEGGDAAAVELPVVRFPRQDARPLRPALARAEVVVAQPPWPHVMHALRRSGARLVFDLYDPEPFENLELLARRHALVRRAVATLTLDRFAAALRAGHHFMCASEAQRDLWLGLVLGERLLPPAAYDADPTLRSRLDVVPFGVPDAPPRRPDPARPGPRALAGTDAEVVLWNGGIWPWLDAPTAVRAVAELARRRPAVKLVFMGGATGPAGEEARRLAGELGVLGGAVLFHDGWVPYGERASWLLEADCALSTHRDHLETRFAFRTRLLDCLWAGLPVVATRGDELGARVERDGLGATAAPRDPAALAAALEQVLERGRAAYAGALARAADDFRWSRVSAPLVRWATATTPPPRPAGGGRLAARARDAGFRAAVRVLPRWPAL